MPQQPHGFPVDDAERVAAFRAWLEQAEGQQAVKDLVARDLPVIQLAEELYHRYRERITAA